MSESIRLDEYLTELDGLRSTNGASGLTDVQYECIKVARGGDSPVRWLKLTKWWKQKGWGDVQINTLKSRYTNAQIRRGDK